MMADNLPRVACLRGTIPNTFPLLVFTTAVTNGALSPFFSRPIMRDMGIREEALAEAYR